MAVLKVIEVLADSDKSFEDAVRTGVSKAAKTVKNIRSAYVQEHSVQVVDNKVSRYRVNLKISFAVED